MTARWCPKAFSLVLFTSSPLYREGTEMRVHMKGKLWPHAHFTKCQLLQTVNRTYGRGSLGLPTQTCLKPSSPDCVLLTQKQPVCVPSKKLLSSQNVIGSCAQVGHVCMPLYRRWQAQVYVLCKVLQQVIGRQMAREVVRWDGAVVWVSGGVPATEKCFSSAAVPQISVV